MVRCFDGLRSNIKVEVVKTLTSVLSTQSRKSTINIDVYDLGYRHHKAAMFGLAVIS